jgi:hypothetical protein
VEDTAPAAPAPVHPRTERVERTPYRAIGRLGTWVTAALALALVADLAAVAVDVAEASLLGRVIEGAAVTDDELTASDTRQAAAAWTQTAMFVLAGAVFVVWFRRAYRNLPALGAEGLRYRSWWTIGAWLIPVWWLFRPKQLANDIWRASDPSLGARAGTHWRVGPLPAILGAWWTAFLAAGVLSCIAARARLAAETPESLRNADVVYAVSDGLDALAAALAIVVVLRMTRRQEERAARILPEQG